MAKGWRYLLCESAEMEVIGELRRASNRQLTVDLNKSGSASGQCPTSLRVSREIWPWRTCIVAQHDDEWYWSGPVTTRTSSLAQGQVTFNAVGWFDRLMHLYLDEQLVFTGEDPSVIIATLLDKARAKDARLPIEMGQVNLSIPRTITYPIDQNIGQAIIDLTTLESGVDWSIDPITRQLDVLNRIGQERRDCKWLFLSDGRSQQSNLSDVTETVDGSTVVNDMIARGKFGSYYNDDPVSKSELGGVFQARPSLSDVVSPDILGAYVEAELVYLSTPRVTYTMTPKSTAKANVPKLFRDFDIGDTTYLTARRDFIEITDQAQRIFGATLAIHDSGLSETLSNIQTTAS